MYVQEVISDQQKKEFIYFPDQLYKHNKYYIKPLDSDIQSVFDIKKNAVAKSDTFKCWLLYDNNKKTIGRIAAFVNEKTVLKNNDYPVGGMGFFECVDNQDAANLLFDTAKKWMETKGMEAMEGPINFGDRDKFWGLLTSGFDKEPNYLANYNPEYYVKLFENYGFKLYFNQFTFQRQILLNFPEANIKKGMDILNNPNFTFTTIKKSKLDRFAEDFRIVYNQAWARHTGVAEMKTAQAKAIFKSMKPVIDENAAFFCYHLGVPVAFFTNIPEMNQTFKHVNGVLNWWGKLVFIYRKLMKKNKKLLGVGFGVIPEFDGKGVTQAITIYAAQILMKKTNYKVIEMHGVGDFNLAMLRFVEKMGETTISKVHTTYRYVFDRNRPYQRMPLKTNNNE